jgi:hypothetical protein
MKAYGCDFTLTVDGVRDFGAAPRDQAFLGLSIFVALTLGNVKAITKT